MSIGVAHFAAAYESEYMTEVQIVLYENLDNTPFAYVEMGLSRDENVPGVPKFEMTDNTRFRLQSKGRYAVARDDGTLVFTGKSDDSKDCDLRIDGAGELPEDLTFDAPPRAEYSKCGYVTMGGKDVYVNKFGFINNDKRGTRLVANLYWGPDPYAFRQE